MIFPVLVFVVLAGSNMGGVNRPLNFHICSSNCVSPANEMSDRKSCNIGLAAENIAQPQLDTNFDAPWSRSSLAGGNSGISHCRGFKEYEGCRGGTCHIRQVGDRSVVEYFTEAFQLPLIWRIMNFKLTAYIPHNIDGGRLAAILDSCDNSYRISHASAAERVNFQLNFLKRGVGTGLCLTNISHRIVGCMCRICGFGGFEKGRNQQCGTKCSEQRKDNRPMGHPPLRDQIKISQSIRAIGLGVGLSASFIGALITLRSDPKRHLAVAIAGYAALILGAPIGTLFALWNFW